MPALLLRSMNQPEGMSEDRLCWWVSGLGCCASSMPQRMLSYTPKLDGLPTGRTYNASLFYAKFYHRLL
jgi:hypothetical protein